MPKGMIRSYLTLQKSKTAKMMAKTVKMANSKMVKTAKTVKTVKARMDKMVSRKMVRTVNNKMASHKTARVMTRCLLKM